MRCADAIAQVISDAERPMRASEIADEINRRGIYSRGDGLALPAYQVASVAHGLPGRFRITEGLIEVRSSQPPPAVAAAVGAPPAADALCVLIGCVSGKEQTARKAKDLYRTELFARRRAYAEASGRPWFIVSALYGLVDPEDVIEPYDVRLADLDRPGREALARQVADVLSARFGSVSGALIEVHAGSEYVQMLTQGLRPLGAGLFNPLRGLRIGQQLKWYGDRRTAGPVTSVPASRPPRAGLAREITAAFQAGDLDLSLRAGAPPAGWAGMPEVIVADRMRQAGATDVEVRLVLTLAAAMDRARDADALWFAAERLFNAHPWAFDPRSVAERPLTELIDVLRTYGVSQRHGPDGAAWRLISEALVDTAASPAVHAAIFDGRGSAPEILQGFQARSRPGTDHFPFLRGPKVGPMLVRMLAHPGGAEIDRLDVVPVAVDVQVRKVTEYLGATDTGPLELDDARPVIQAAWARDVAEHGAVGPPALDGTAAALDPALWFWAKWGCTRCERAEEQLPVNAVCGGCRFPVRG